MHLRGNIEGFLRAASRDKWLSCHVGKHWESFYLPEYVAHAKALLQSLSARRDRMAGTTSRESGWSYAIRAATGAACPTDFLCRKRNQPDIISTLIQGHLVLDNPDNERRGAIRSDGRGRQFRHKTVRTGYGNCRLLSPRPT